MFCCVCVCTWLCMVCMCVRLAVVLCMQSAVNCCVCVCNRLCVAVCVCVKIFNIQRRYPFVCTFVFLSAIVFFICMYLFLAKRCDYNWSCVNVWLKKEHTPKKGIPFTCVCKYTLDLLWLKLLRNITDACEKRRNVCLIIDRF